MVIAVFDCYHFFIEKEFYMKKFLLFILCIIISFAPGLIGIMFTPMGHSDIWFNGLNQSALTPAPWVFATVWTILYFLLGVALFLVVQNNQTRYSKVKPYLLFATQMALNALWSCLLFGLHMVAADYQYMDDASIQSNQSWRICFSLVLYYLAVVGDIFKRYDFVSELK